jgi:hypothetical protein
MWFLVIFFSFSVFAQEYYLHCDNGKDIEECSIITDGYYAVKRKNAEHAGSTNDAFIKNYEAKNLVVKNYKVINCKECEAKEPSPIFAIKFIIQKKLPKEYWNYVKNNAITDIKKFNKNGYLLAFDVSNDDRYIIFFKDAQSQIRVGIGAINEVLMQPNCRNTINLHLDADFLVRIPKSVNNIQAISTKEAEKSRIDMRIQNCQIAYYHKYYAKEVYDKINKLKKI